MKVVDIDGATHSLPRDLSRYADASDAHFEETGEVEHNVYKEAA